MFNWVKYIILYTVLSYVLLYGTVLYHNALYNFILLYYYALYDVLLCCIILYCITFTVYCILYHLTILFPFIYHIIPHAISCQVISYRITSYYMILYFICRPFYMTKYRRIYGYKYWCTHTSLKSIQIRHQVCKVTNLNTDRSKLGTQWKLINRLWTFTVNQKHVETVTLNLMPTEAKFATILVGRSGRVFEVSRTCCLFRQSASPVVFHLTFNHILLF